MDAFRLKDELLLGLVSPATQSEGGELESSWIYWWGLGGVRDRTSPAVAAQHAERRLEDAALLGSLGVQTLRLGVDWTRVEPQEGVFDEAALARYRVELSALRAQGIRVTLELHRYTNPAWFEQRDGFEREENLPFYLEYVRRAAAVLGDLADGYLTFAEPNAYALGGYLGGGFPPGKNNVSTCYRVLTHMARCHVLTYAQLHALHEERGYPPCRVSVALRAQRYLPEQEDSVAHRLLASAAERSLSASFRAFYRGETQLPLKYDRFLKPGLYCDFLAFDWFGESRAGALQDVTPAAGCGDADESGPMLALLRAMHALAPLPIHLTLCPQEDGARTAYLARCLRAVSDCDLPVERCLYPRFTDGFEWIDGHSLRLGLVHVDFDTQERRVKPSGEFFARCARERTVALDAD